MLQDIIIPKKETNIVPRRPTTLNPSQESILRNRQQRKATLSRRHRSPLKSTTRHLENIQRKPIKRIPRINHIPTTRILHRTMMRRKKIRRQNIMLNTLNLQNCTSRTKRKMKWKMKRKKRVASMRNAVKPTRILTKSNLSNLNITGKTSSRNLRNRTGRNCQNKVRIRNL